MKKNYLFCLALASLQFVNAQEQIFANEDFNSLTSGALATDPSGATQGQNGWLIYGGSPADYQVRQIDATHAQSLSITTGNSFATTNNPSNRFAFKAINPASISSANNFITGKLDMYTGNIGSTGTLQATYFNATSGIVGIYFDGATRTIRGLGNLTVNGTSGLYNVGLGTQTYPANTWLTVAYTYNKTTGGLTWKVGSNNYTFSNPAALPTPGLVPSEFDILGLTIAANNVTHTGSVDNVLMRATNNILATNETAKDIKLAISVYPNPSSDFVSVKSDSKINKINVFDITGKSLSVQANDNTLDVRQLPVGTYIISIETNDGVYSNKFIKK